MHHLFTGFFQLGYVTQDVDAACAAFRTKFGPIEFLVNTPPPINGVDAPTRRIALSWIDDIMTEIIEPDPAQKTIYDDAVPAAQGAIHLHHFGYLVDDHDATIRRLHGLGYAVPLHGEIEGFIGYSYADTRADLGVFSEFIRPEQAGHDFFGSVPRLRTR